MQEIKLTQMRIRNFKGIRELDIAFNGKDMNVFGDNGTGKTTIIDSFTWLLFGKDSLGRADFGIKPTDSAGNIIHQLETSVEAIFDISGTEKVFKKTLIEVWTRKRGAAEAEFTRNENSFYIDGVPKKKSEYEAAIKELIDENVFKIITNPLYFNESVNWKDRRSVLLAICGEVTDEEVIASKVELAPLIPLLQGKSVSDFKDITASAMKRINQELDMIPVKINEAELAKPSAAALDVNLAKKDLLTQEIEELRIKKSNIKNGAAVIEERAKLTALNQKLAMVGKDFSIDKQREKDLENEIANSEFMAQQSERKSRGFMDEIDKKTIERERLSKEWDEVFSVRFMVTDSICPTCHRELPEEEVEEKRKAFNAKKAQKLDSIEKQNEKIGLEIDGLKEAAEAEAEIAEGFRADIEKVESELNRVRAEHAVMVATEQERVSRERAKIEREIFECESLIKTYEDSTEELAAEIDSCIAEKSLELSTINEAVANKALLERQDKRIAELREQQTRLATEYTKHERNMYLAEQFIIAKVNMLNERINHKFKYAKFKLFDKQINGGINEVCEVTYNGIPYKDLNNAMKINIGLDIINTLCEHYGVCAPIFTDNAESVNRLFSTAAQQICFYVTYDKPLRVKEATF